MMEGFHEDFMTEIEDDEEKEEIQGYRYRLELGIIWSV